MHLFVLAQLYKGFSVDSRGRARAVEEEGEEKQAVESPVAARAPRNVRPKQCIVVQYSPAEYELAFRLRADDMAALCRLQFDSLPLRFARFGHTRFPCTHVTHVLVEGVFEKG